MGKKDSNKKKGLGAEKTASKTDKKLLAKQKKMLAKLGEEDIEKIVESMQHTKDSVATESIEVVCSPPSARINFAIASHPEKEEFYILGGEFFNGKKTIVYGDFFNYNCLKNEFKHLSNSICPSPRSSSQLVATSNKLWLFGGEYASVSGQQFYHYKDFWAYCLKQRSWEKINANNPPSARSGHRMVYSKKRLIIFGGFYDNNQTSKYFNDVHVFSMENYTWTKLDVTGTPPAPRSASCITVTTDQRILIWGGYSKMNMKKDVEKGTTHSDMFSLTCSENVWKWAPIKSGGNRPAPRSGVSCASAPNGCRVYCFGGVMDQEETEDNLRGQFSNEIYYFEPTPGNIVWRKLELISKKKEDKEHQTIDSEMSEPEAAQTSVKTDGVFTITVKATASSSGNSSGSNVVKNNAVIDGSPSPRMNSGIIFSKGHLYIFGGSYEQGHRQFTLCDFYSLDIQKLDHWRTIIGNIPSLLWEGSDSENSNSEDDEDKTDSDSSDETSDDEMDIE